MKNIVNVSEYPYGKINKRLRDCCKWLNKNQNRIKKKIQQWETDIFDYPDYWGLPSKLNRLDSDEVDFIQDQTYKFYEKYVRDCY